MTPDRAIGSCPFTDGAERVVYEDAEGRQYVLGYDGEPVYGQWLPPADEPTAVELRQRQTLYGGRQGGRGGIGPRPGL
jgi:hypothetical protein